MDFLSSAVGGVVFEFFRLAKGLPLPKMWLIYCRPDLTLRPQLSFPFPWESLFLT